MFRFWRIAALSANRLEPQVQLSRLSLTLRDQQLTRSEVVFRSAGSGSEFHDFATNERAGPVSGRHAAD